MKLFDRYIFGQFAIVIAIATLSIIGVFFGTIEFQKIIKQATDFGIPIKTLFLVNTFQLPTCIMFALPGGVLVATMIVLIRQHIDNEILALQICGVSKWRIMAPFLGIALVASMVSFVLGSEVAPQSRYLSSKLLLTGLYSSQGPFTSRKFVDLRDKNDKLLQLIILGRSVGQCAKGFLVLDLSQPECIKMVWSQYANWQKGRWNLRDGNIFELLREDDTGARGRFGAMELAGISDLWRKVEQGPVSNFDKTTGQLLEQEKSLRKAKQKVPPTLLMTIASRYSQPASCFLLVLAAAPVALLRKRTEKNFAYIYGGCLVVSYFILQQAFRALGDIGRMDPTMAAWLPLLLLAAVGIFVSSVRRL